MPFQIQRQDSLPTPPLSVVVVALGGHLYLPRCLRALMRQAGVKELDILVPCDDRILPISALQEQFPAVRFLHVEGRRTYAELRALGVQKARGAIVAITEDHCTPDPDWCAQVLAAHLTSFAAVGGIVEKGQPDTILNWALYLADYVRYMCPMTEGPARHLTDCNVSYKRPALEAISDIWRREFHEPEVHSAIRARGGILWFSPRIVVRQQRSLSFASALQDRFVFGRLFGSCRTRSMSHVRRVAYAFCCIGLPALLPARVALHVLRKRSCLGPFLFSLPALVLLSVAWAFGEFVGYVTGYQGESMLPGAHELGEPV